MSSHGLLENGREKRQHIIGMIFFFFLPVPYATLWANQLLRKRKK